MTDATIDLFRGSPFLPAQREPWDVELRKALRFFDPTIRFPNDSFDHARLALADRLEEESDPEQWLARWPWRLHEVRGASGGRSLATWYVDGLPAVGEFLGAAFALVGRVNEKPMLGWMAGEVRLIGVTQVRSTRTTTSTLLRFTALEGRCVGPGELDTTTVPGGFAGLAWLSARITDDVRREAS